MRPFSWILGAHKLPAGIKKNLIVAVDRFSRWPSAMVCNTNRSNKILKFLKQCKNNHGMPRRIHVEQGKNFTSKNVKAFCNAEGVEIVQSPLNDLRVTGFVERAIGSLKNSILTCAREKQPEPLEKMVERTLRALRFSTKATLKITPFEAHHGREANTVLRNLTKKPSLRNLNWLDVLKSKSACFDKQDAKAQQMPKPADTNWGMRSDNEYRGTQDKIMH